VIVEFRHVVSLLSSGRRSRPNAGGDHPHDDVELQLELDVEQVDEVEHEQVVDEVLELVLEDPAKSSLGVESMTSKVSASSRAIWSLSSDMVFPPLGFSEVVGPGDHAPASMGRGRRGHLGTGCSGEE